MHLDPDYLQKVIITVEGSVEEIVAELQMTALWDVTLQEAHELMASAVEADPHLKTIEDNCLKQAIARRAKASGFFPDSRDPANYGRIEYLEKKAKALGNVEVRPTNSQGPTVMPGGVMDRIPKPQVYQTRQADASPRELVVVPAKKPIGRTFKPIKESKL